MDTKNSNERPIENLKGDSINGGEILGGGKTVPIIIEQEGMAGIPQDVDSSVSISPINDAADYADNANPLHMTDGTIDLK